MEQVQGVPAGYRLGKLVKTQGGGLGDGLYAVVELVPDEQPNQYEAVIVVDCETNAKEEAQFTARGIRHHLRHGLYVVSSVTVREKGAN